MGTKVVDAEKKDGKVLLNVEDAKSGEKSQLDADVVLVAIGRRPVTNGLNLEAIGVEKDERGRIIVDDQYNTTCKGVKCIGDATFGPMLAHKAEEEGIAAVEIIKTGHGHVNYAAIPSVVYTHPEVAWVGKTEEDLKKEGVEYKTGKFPFLANSRAKTNADAEGTVKFLVEKETDKVLGVHIIGPNAGEMIASAVLAIELPGVGRGHCTNVPRAPHALRGVQGGRHGVVLQGHPLLSADTRARFRFAGMDRGARCNQDGGPGGISGGKFVKSIALHLRAAVVHAAFLNRATAAAATAPALKRRRLVTACLTFPRCLLGAVVNHSDCGHEEGARVGAQECRQMSQRLRPDS
ncbi:hypothetical protein L1887_53237 [Cichorium endivia]|nr:hypothetical protein L1887_53237 [Cichorium endivia]